jgi:hypothetical protein
MWEPVARAKIYSRGLFPKRISSYARIEGDEHGLPLLPLDVGDLSTTALDGAGAAHPMKDEKALHRPEDPD